MRDWPEYVNLPLVVSAFVMDSSRVGGARRCRLAAFFISSMNRALAFFFLSRLLFFFSFFFFLTPSCGFVLVFAEGCEVAADDCEVGGFWFLNRKLRPSWENPAVVFLWFAFGTEDA